MLFECVNSTAQNGLLSVLTAGSFSVWVYMVVMCKTKCAVANCLKWLKYFLRYSLSISYRGVGIKKCSPVSGLHF